MQRIFKDERRGLASSLTNPFRTGRISPAATIVATTSQAPYVGPATRCRLLLTAGEMLRRHDNILILSRP